MNHKETVKFLSSLTSPTRSVLLKADHGKGKSAAVGAFAKERNLFLIDARLGQLDVGDIVGYPVVQNGKFIHILSEFLKPAFDGPPAGFDGVLLFFDEYNRGTKDVRQVCFQIILDRKMHGESLHQNTWVFAAINDDMEKYEVGEMDPASSSRFAQIKYEPTADEWMAWGKQEGIAEEILFLISTQKDVLDPSPKITDEELKNPHPNRRSWHFFSDWYLANKDKSSVKEIKDACSTFVGGKAAEAFKLACELMDQTKATHGTNTQNVDKKVIDFMNAYLKKYTLPKTEAKTFFKGMTVDELAASADAIADYMSQWKYMNPEQRERLDILFNNIPDEYASKIYHSIGPDVKVRLDNKYFPDWAAKYAKK